MIQPWQNPRIASTHTLVSIGWRRSWVCAAVASAMAKSQLCQLSQTVGAIHGFAPQSLGLEHGWCFLQFPAQRIYHGRVMRQFEVSRRNKAAASSKQQQQQLKRIEPPGTEIKRSLHKGQLPSSQMARPPHKCPAVDKFFTREIAIRAPNPDIWQ